jgi:hypothetical protein
VETIVEVEGVNGEWFTIAGPNAGDKGISLGTDVKGAFYDPPVKVVYEEPGNFPGARYLNDRILRRDITFGVEILNDKGSDSWMSRDSQWRKAWSFKKDTKIHVTTDLGTRYLKVRLGESPDVLMDTDPNDKGINRTVMVCISGDPFWYEDDVVYTATTVTDTTFDPNPLPWPWPRAELPTETLTISVSGSDPSGGLNPTDQPVFLKWSAPGSTQAPSAPYIPGIPWLGAPKSPATIWTIPDYSFPDDDYYDPTQATRRIAMPGQIGGLRTEEVQAVYITGRPTSGHFNLTLNGETTGNIAWNATPAAVVAALNALAYITAGDVTADIAAATNEVQVVYLTGGPTAGTFTLTFNGETTVPIPFNASEGVVRSALVGLASVGSLDVGVTAQSVNEVQVVTLVGEPTDGTWTLTFAGETTDPIAWDASAYTVQSALLKLDIIHGGLFQVSDVSVKKPSGTYQPYTVTFKGNFAGIDLQPMIADPSLLTGGAGIDIDVTTQTQGSTVYAVTFKGQLGGFDFDLMTANSSGLTGGVSPLVNVSPSVDGSRPYLVTFTGTKSGLDVPSMGIDTSGLGGGTGVTGRVETLREGVTAPAENVVIDTDPRVEQVSSESGSPIWSRMNGVRFRNPVPPYTASKSFEITVSGCVVGQMVSLRIPRPWSRPWGLQ